MENYIDVLNTWKSNCKDDLDLVKELNEIEKDPKAVEDAFYKELSFGTGGLRGVIGAGTNRMNIYTVRKASQGLANYVCKNFPNNKTIAISYDSRIKSRLFAENAASVFAANGIKSYIYPELMPTPCLSFAVRHLGCASGIMVTASHNPSKYNGYKVYGSDGCQITALAADLITKEINAVNPFDVKVDTFESNIASGLIEYISEDTVTAFIDRVKEESMLKNEHINKNFAIVYSPLNGTGLKPVTRILKETGFNNVTVVKEQENPDGNFPTCPFPNPELKEAMKLGVELAKKLNADLFLATDPDCDRVGIAVKNKNNEFELLTGNQVGILLLDFICSMRIKNGTMPKHAHAVKTIVSTDMADLIARNYNVTLHNVLTGFKYIGDVIANLEKDHQESSYILGFEESYGYLSGSYVRDKDAVDASLLICEMFAYYKNLNISLLDKLNELYTKYGYFYNTLDNYQFEGKEGAEKILRIMDSFRNIQKNTIKGHLITKIVDYSLGINGLPKSNVIKLFIDDTHTIVVRPSGTEPKMKMYGSYRGNDQKEAEKIYQEIKASISSLF